MKQPRQEELEKTRDEIRSMTRKRGVDSASKRERSIGILRSMMHYPKEEINLRGASSARAQSYH
jgi:hypothetical protein